VKEAPDSGASSKRIDSIDTLRGLAILLMLLDHLRQMAAPAPFPIMDPDLTSPGLFLTRWITHLGASAFIVLAGTAAFLYEQKRGRDATIHFLWTRGLWLIVLELTLVHWPWLDFSQPYFGVTHFQLQVIWVIGVSMIALAGLIRLRRRAIWIFTIVLIAGHNGLDWIRPRHLGDFRETFAVLFRYRHWRPAENVEFYFSWPLIPWVAVLSLGYLAGSLYLMDAERRRRILVYVGLGMIALFVALRAFNLYGDPNPWSANDRGAIYTLLSFLGVEKYPPSLQFLLMTLGPSCLLLVLFENTSDPISRFLRAFGRVPLFFYLLHVPAARIAALLWWWVAYGAFEWWRTTPRPLPEAYDPSLGTVYIGTVLLMLILFPVMRWYWRVKSTRRHPWLRYL
jgi:uncharacterized membrane protein